MRKSHDHCSSPSWSPSSCCPMPADLRHLLPHASGFETHVAVVHRLALMCAGVQCGKTCSFIIFVPGLFRQTCSQNGKLVFSCPYDDSSEKEISDAQNTRKTGAQNAKGSKPAGYLVTVILLNECLRCNHVFRVSVSLFL